MRKIATFLFAALFAANLYSQAPTIAGDLLLCPNTNGTASVTNAQVYDSYKWYWKYWFTSDPFVEIAGANGPSFTYDWYTYDQAQFKLVVTLGGNTYESNIIQIDSYAWVGLTMGYQDSDNISQDPNTGNVLLCQGTGFTIEVYMPYTSVQWYRNGQPIPGATNMQYHITDAGSYHVVAAPGFCPNSTSSTEGLPIVVEIDTDCALGVGDHETAPLAVYPNPANNHISISAQQPIERLAIYNMTGQLVRSEKPNVANPSVDLSSLASGMYILEAESSGMKQKVKLIKQ